MNISIIDEKKEWDTLVESFQHSDSYHSYEYHVITKNKSDRPILIKYTEGDKTIALPMLLRQIPGTPYMDATSVYGYAGPLTQNVDSDFDNNNFINKIKTLLNGLGVVSVFSRLNPFIPYQGTVLSNLGNISYCGKVVNIDITKDLDTQRKGYNRRLKSYINKSRNQYISRLATSENEITAFVQLYHENMRRVNAAKDYFFDRNYFFNLLNSTNFKTEVLISEDIVSKKIIAAAMFLKKNNIVQYHLSGASKDYLHLNPIKMLIDEMRIMATTDKYRYFNLGGGVGSSKDSLFQFKSGFSKDYKDFQLWKFIVNKPQYEKLTNLHFLQQGISATTETTSFFPSYRY